MLMPYPTLNRKKDVLYTIQHTIICFYGKSRAFAELHAILPKSELVISLF